MNRPRAHLRVLMVTIVVSLILLLVASERGWLMHAAELLLQESSAIPPVSQAENDQTAYLPLVQAIQISPILTATPMPTATTQRLQPADFSYLGAFRLPREFDWGGRGVSYYPAGDGGQGSLFVLGFEAQPALFGEVSIPAPARTPDWEQLPIARLLRGPVEFDGTLIEDTLDASTTFAGDVEYVPRRGSQTSDKLYGCADWWYAVSEETFPTVWFSELDGSRPRGMFAVGSAEAPFHGNRAGDYLFTAPAWYAAEYLGGRTLVIGKTRGAFGGSMGPTLIAFHPWETENPAGNLDAIPLLWYPLDFACASPNVSDRSRCLYPDFTMCDKWFGAAFVERGEHRAVLLVGIKGLGGNRYGQPEAGDCNPYQGYHCDPFERQVIFYDVEELGQAALGQRDPTDITPYTIWRPAELYLGDAAGQTCGEMGGMTFDAAGRLYVVEKGMGNANSAVVHMWGVR